MNKSILVLYIKISLTSVLKFSVSLVIILFSPFLLNYFLNFNWLKVFLWLIPEKNYSFLDFYNNSNLNYFKNSFNLSWWDFINSFNDNLHFLQQNYLDFPIFVLFGGLFLSSSLISLLSVNFLGFYGIYVLNFYILILFWLSFLPYIEYIIKDNGYYYINFGKWMYLNSNYKIFFDLYIDNISLSFSFLTLTIAIFVYNFTFAYFRYEPLVDRLIVLLNLFIISMMFLVSSGNLVSLFLGWEMIGLTSFFLINFWVSRIGTLKAAFKAYSFNKISDLFLLFGIFLIFNIYFSLDIVTLLNQAPLFIFQKINIFVFELSYNDLICFFFLVCAFIKSAQFGAHIWLPDSMEAPVPASALIHSATLVSAGIFLLLRFNVFFDYSIFSIFLISVVGSFTAFYGGFVSMYQSDTKKILAYSTISHCGFLMVLVSFNIIEFTLLYLYIHGFFKAAVFMCVGNVNRLSKNNQDFKQMGMYYKYLPFDCFLSCIGLINLAGLPFSLGFYIKHLLFLSLNFNVYFYYIILLNCLGGALSGLFYCSRLIINIFFDFKKSKVNLYINYNRKNLNSFFYSNTSLISNFAIFSLFFCSYLFGFYFLHLYLSKIMNYSDTVSFLLTNNHYFIYIHNSSILFNISLINWIIILVFSSIVFSSWRSTFFSYLSINNFFSLYFILLIFFCFL